MARHKECDTTATTGHAAWAIRSARPSMSRLLWPVIVAGTLEEAARQGGRRAILHNSLDATNTSLHEFRVQPRIVAQDEETKQRKIT